MAQKPDRFERMVEKAQDSFEALYLDKDQIVKILRRQHLAYIRMVEAHNRYIQSFPEREIQRAWKDGNKYACTELLNQFAEYKR